MSTQAVMETVEQATGKKASRLNLLDNSVCLSLQMSKLGQTRKVSTAQIETDADKRFVRVQKRLMDCPEMDAISALQANTRIDIYSICLPSFFREGMYFCPLALVQKADALLESAVNKQSALVESLVAVLDRIYEDDQVRLGSLHNPGDRVTPDKVRKAFAINWNYTALAAPSSLANISEEVYAREEKKISEQIQSATDAITMVMRQELKEFVDWLTDRTTPEEDGKRKRLRSPKDPDKADRLDKFREFLNNFAARNIAGDEDCAAIVERAKALLSGVDTEGLKKSDSLREMVKNGLAPIKAEIDSLVYTEGMRAIEV
jgi:hypothetical protein